VSQIAPGRFTSQDGGEQLRLLYAPSRRLLEVEIGVDDNDDLSRAERSLTTFGVAVGKSADSVSAVEPVTGVQATLRAMGHFAPPPTPATPYNGPGRVERPNGRAPGILREGPVRPRKLGHIVIGSTDEDTSRRFFTEGLGFKTSDHVPGAAAFLRCSTDHHNVLVQATAVSFLHHTAWEVDDVDEVGRGATAMPQEHPERHVWGLGRHQIGSDFFWYLRDPRRQLLRVLLGPRRDRR